MKREYGRISTHNPAWITYGAKIVGLFEGILGGNAVEVKHVGSTAVAGLKAKAIVDIAVGVRKIADILPFEAEMAKNGIIRHPDGDNEQNRFFYIMPATTAGSYHVYVNVVVHGGTYWNCYVRFLECLKQDSDVRGRYEELKEALSARTLSEKSGYYYGKSDFIKRTLRTKCDIRERSCGAVVWRMRGGRRHYLIIKNRSGHNGFPKGHMEYGETEAETALREIFEETSLRVTLDTSFKAEYRYLVYGYIHKSALYFLASYSEGEFKPQKGEVYGIWLLPFEEALEQLDYEQDRRVLRLAEKRLKNEEK